jgi:hypothetical protein
MCARYLLEHELIDQGEFNELRRRLDLNYGTTDYLSKEIEKEGF